MTDGWAAMLNDVTLADRLRAIVAEPRRWSKADRDALILAAAARLDSVYGSPGGGTTRS